MPIDKPARVIICEDDKVTAEIVAGYMTEAGHEVKVCYDGPSTIALAAAWSPTAAIIDIGLPCISGYAVAQHLRKQLGDELLIVALTAHDTPAEIEMARYAGFDWHFAKPAQYELIVDVVANPRRTPVAPRDGIPLSV